MTGVRAGWIVVGAISLLNRAKTGTVPWHEVVLEGGGLAIDAFAAANATLPNEMQVSSDWAEGASFLVEATKHAADGSDGNQFLMEQWLDQTIPIECTKKADVARHGGSEHGLQIFVSGDKSDQRPSQTLTTETMRTETLHSNQNLGEVQNVTKMRSALENVCWFLGHPIQRSRISRPKIETSSLGPFLEHQR